uniref:HEAT repeat containing 9 n=1 Tax=Rousettus aegyptiacus TaxID=9407 RepID=A0A7J8G8Y5_ROUAE|nr:HEAT repeat containing 9 [Rousettus aegyptiacus]
MAYEKSANLFDVARSMFKYPWLEYPGRTKELRKATAPVYLPLSCHQMPKEEFPPSPECWRQHPSKPNAVPYCYFKKPEIYTHWHTLYDQQQERETQKMLQKMRDHPRYHKVGTPTQNFHLPMIKLTTKSQTRYKTLHPSEDPLKWQRLKELTKSLKSPIEDEQFYAAQAQTSPKKVKNEACRTLAILGCLNKHVIQALIKQLKGQNEGQRMETLTGLRVALNSWAAIPKDKRTQVGDEGKLVPVLQMLIQKSSNEAAVEAALCLGFLRPCNNTAQEFLLQCLCQGPMTQRIKHRLEATQMLKTIGLEQIQTQGLEGLVFDLLSKKIYNEPFFAMRQAVAETMEELKMKHMMMNLVEAQLMNSDAAARQEAIISLGVLGIRSPQVFHLLLDMLDEEKNQSVKKSLQETLILLASIDPWIQNKLKNKVFLIYEAPTTNEKVEPTRFRKKPENPEELNIQDFRLAQLNPLFIAKSIASSNQEKKLSDQKGFAYYLNSAFPPCFSKPQKHNSQATGPWVPEIRKQLQILAKTSK